ncbi:MAG: hypothetical protein SF097_21525 [Acidobacteriota bacterium]|nr:hypothetical protein [Acidobacteriota bacterium]
MRVITFFIVCCALAAIAPFIARQTISSNASIPFPGWPTELENRPLTEQPLTEREQQFTKDFPGRIARFTTPDSREIILRWVTQNTRILHPASDCFRGLGYSIHPQPLTADAKGNHWGTFEARRGNEKLLIRERIYSIATNQSWPDVSSWYWQTMFGKASTKTGGWMAVTIAEFPAQTPSLDK